MERWQNKVAVVTGAGGGIGSATCRALLAKGLIIAGLDKQEERIQKEFKASLLPDQQKRFHTRKCDITKDSEVKDAFAWVEDTLGGVDILVNNAGVASDTQLVAQDNAEQLKNTLETNVLGVALCTREAFQSMKKRNVDGHVIIMNSVAGHIVPVYPGYSFNMYAPSKYALTAMTEVLRQEFQAQNTKIKVTSISPSAVDTEILAGGNNFRDKIVKLRPEDIADAIVYCLQTPPHVQIQELTIKSLGAKF